MATQARRATASSSTISSKRPSTDNSTKVPPIPAKQPKKRPALTNLTNRNNCIRNDGKSSIKQVQGSVVNSKKRVSTLPSGKNILQENLSHVPTITKQIYKNSSRTISIPRDQNVAPVIVPTLQPCNTALSPHRSEGTFSVDETMSTCDSVKSPDIEYVDNNDVAAVASLERRTFHSLNISKDADVKAGVFKGRISSVQPMEEVVALDNDQRDPQLCASFACDIYEHLKEAEITKRASTVYMENIQKDINANMRGILIDWLVEVAEEYRLVTETLFLTVNYIDRYLSGNVVNRQQLQLLGVACMLIASKYEEICAPQVEEFCYITDNTYFRDEVLQMESDVLKHLKFEMTALTANCFLKRFVRAAQASCEENMNQLEFLASYLAELSLLEYQMLNYLPSLVAAGSIFLTKFILQPSKRPWNSTLKHYTQYEPSELRQCVMILHNLFCNGGGKSFPAIREKYSQHKYKFVAKKCCPAAIPSEFFQDTA